jgi:hypothetical protein
MSFSRSTSIAGLPVRHRIVRVLAAALVVLVLCVAVTELILRFVVGLGNPILIQADPACEYILKPDQNVFRFFVHTRTNHYGMRSDEVPAARQAGALRILFVGDSITYGTTRVDQRDIFTEILHRDLPSLVNRPVEVLNASAGAWAPDNELSYLRSRGIFHSDLVVLVLNDGDLTQSRATVAEVGDELPLKRPSTAIGEFCTRYIRPRVLHWLRHNDAGDNMVANADRVTRENLADIDSIEQLVRSQGARLIVAYIPFRRDIPEQARSAEASFKAWADAHQVAILDLTAAELPYTAGEITLDNGVHFNARGNSIVAHAIEQAWPQVISSH